MAKSKSKSKPKASPADAADERLATLARLLLGAAAANTHINEIASALRVSGIAIYKWLSGSPISGAYAFLLVHKLRHRIETISNKRQLEQARKLLEECKADLEGQA